MRMISFSPAKLPSRASPLRAFRSRNDNVLPKITGLKVKISEANKEAFEKACSTPDIPVLLETVAKSYELTGSIIGEIEISTTKQVTSEFEVRCTDGAGIRES